MEQVIHKLKERLRGQLPGPDIQYQMAPALRHRTDPETLQQDQYRLSAVMVLFCLDEDGNWFIPLTQRFTYEGVHSGQISLPGGKFEPEDKTTDRTALRECEEEIGISEQVVLIGALSKLYIPVSGFLVEPWVGVMQQRSPVFSLNPREVERVVRLKVSDLLDHSIVKTGDIEIPGRGLNMKIKTPWFETEGLRIWGATAMILNEVKTIAASIF